MNHKFKKKESAKPNDSNFFNKVEQSVEEYYQPLYRFAFSLTKNQHEACDLTQQTFLIFSIKGEKIKDFSKIKSWLFTTLYREFLGMRRKYSRFQEFDFQTFEVEDRSQRQLYIIKQEESHSISTSLQKIESIYREVIILYYLKDLSYKEISDVLNIPIGTVMSRLSRGKKQLKSIMKFKKLATENTNTNELKPSDKAYKNIKRHKKE